MTARAFDIESLEREATSRTGLEDFGGGDWREALGVLLDSALREARLTETGRAIVRGERTPARPGAATLQRR